MFRRKRTEAASQSPLKAQTVGQSEDTGIVNAEAEELCEYTQTHTKTETWHRITLKDQYKPPNSKGCRKCNKHVKSATILGVIRKIGEIKWATVVGSGIQ